MKSNFYEVFLQIVYRFHTISWMWNTVDVNRFHLFIVEIKQHSEDMADSAHVRRIES